MDKQKGKCWADRLVSIVPNGKNKARMDKRQEVRNILNDLRRGDIGWVKAQDKICALLDVIGQSGQCFCERELGTTKEGKCLKGCYYNDK